MALTVDERLARLETLVVQLYEARHEVNIQEDKSTSLLTTLTAVKTTIAAIKEGT